MARGFAHRAPDMDTLVGLATLTAWAYSAAATLVGFSTEEGHGGHGPHVYFETAVAAPARIPLSPRMR